MEVEEAKRALFDIFDQWIEGKIDYLALNDQCCKLGCEAAKSDDARLVRLSDIADAIASHYSIMQLIYG